MRKMLLALLAALAVIVAGCSGSGAPKAVTPETQHDFGDVPVTEDMSKAERKTFVIKNEGTADLKLSDVQVKLLQGC